MVLVSGLLAACGGGSNPFNAVGTGGGGGGGGGSTLTLSALSSPTGLVYSTTISGVSGSITSRVWTNTAGDMLDVLYTVGAAEETLGVAVTTGTTTVWAGGTPSTYSANSIICHVSGTNTLGWPLCSSWGISVSRSGGTISFSNTPAFNQSTTTTTGTMSGSFTFPPF